MTRGNKEHALIPYRAVRSLESQPDRIWTAWRSPGRFTKNPDMVALPSGRLLAVYADIDKHWAEGLIKLTLIESMDRGRTWSLAGVITEADRSKREPHWVTPRISLLTDGRLVVICDRDDFEHCHEYQAPGTYLWWSEDEGRTWSEAVNTGIPGIEPDRVVELPGGRLAVGAHMAFADTQKLGQFVCLSDDGGHTWGQPVIIAKDQVHNYCEGAIVPLQDGSVVCVMRDNTHNNYPCQVSFSFDNGQRWTEPVEAPFSGDRVFIGQLPDGRLLATYRNQGGNRGTYAWLGDIQRESGYRCTAFHLGPEEIALDAVDGLHIAHRSPATTAYNLLPPESFRSEVLFEATLRVRPGTGDQSPVVGEPIPSGANDRSSGLDNCAYVQIARVGVRLHARPDGLWIGDASHSRQAIDRHWPADLSEWHTIRVHHKGGLVRYYLDGQEVMRNHLLYEALPLSPGGHQDALGPRTYFGTAPNTVGEAWWRSVKYHVRNPSEPEFFWAWAAASGEFPDQYELDRYLELHANTHERADNGYSTWLRFDDGEILVLDYTNDGDPYGQSHIVACSLFPEDFETMGRRPYPLRK
jgi:hypothetical protein